MTPLHMAAASGRVDAVRDVLLAKPDVNARTVPNGFTPLHLCVSGDLTDSTDRQAIISLLVEAGSDLEARTSDKGLTPLQLAAMRNKPLCVAGLLRCGANLHATEGNGATALHGAAFFGHAGVCELLVRAGADPKLADRHGNTPLALAANAGHTRVHEILLVSCGGKLSEDERLVAAAQDGKEDLARTALAAGANPNARRNDGATALSLASERGFGVIVRDLLDKGADVNASRPDNGATALLFASQNGHVDIVRMLLEKGPDVRAKASDGKTALMAAALDGRTEIVRMLIQHGSIVNESKSDGFTPLMLAAFDGHADTARVLLENGADASAFAVIRGERYTALKIAVAKGHSHVVEVLAASTTPGAGPKDAAPDDPNAAERLLQAVTADDLAAVRSCLSAGVSPNAITFEPDDGWTLLHEAVVHSLDVVRELVAHGAAINAATRLGYTPLMRAAGRGSLDVVKFLVAQGADQAATDNHGQTAAIMAEAEYKSAIADYLWAALPLYVKEQCARSEKYQGKWIVPFEESYLSMVRMCRRSVGGHVRRIDVTFDDGTALSRVEVLADCVAILPSECKGKRVKTMSVPTDQRS